MLKERSIAELNKLVCAVKKDMDEQNVPYSDLNFTLNPRLTRALGRCIRRRNFWGDDCEVKVELQKDYFLYGKESDIRNTICHELIHSAEQCSNCGHTGLWLRYANIMNKHGYDIHRMTSIEENFKPKVEYRYEAYCPNCGMTWKRKTKSELIKNPQRWSCGKCHTKLKSREIK